MAGLTLRPLVDKDCGLLMIWLNSPHVRRWCVRGDLTTEDAMEDALDLIGARDDRADIVELEGRAIGYIQALKPVDSDRMSYLSEAPEGAFSLDVFIGDVSLTGAGLGPQILQIFAQDLFRKGATCLLAAPDLDNRPAISAFAKAGFTPMKPTGSSPCLPIKLMSKTPTLNA